jgi:hypothetical protein
LVSGNADTKFWEPITFQDKEIAVWIM